MKFARVRFDSDDACARALKGLAMRMRITVLRDESFVVPERGLAWLDGEGLRYEFLEWMHQDNVVQALRDHLAHPV
ncbi:MAG: hypothetical protein HYY24_05440 [Verrucomicrobia bacterium]|nr:hypothetical protein [Verrucomicrobiota bacterium]